MVAWHWLFVFAFAGFIACYFIMRNNPKYFGIDKMLKAKKYELTNLGIDKLKELHQKIGELIK